MCACNDVYVLKLPLLRYKSSVIDKDPYLTICAIKYAEEQDLEYYNINDNCIFCSEFCYILFKNTSNENQSKKSYKKSSSRSI